MKKRVFTLLIIASFSGMAFAQEEAANNPDGPENKNVFQLSPLHLFGSQLRVGYERSVGKKSNSVLVLGGVTLKSSSSEIRSGGVAELHFRATMLYAESESASIRLFMGPMVKYKYLQVESYDSYSYWSSPNYVYVTDTVTDYVSSGMLGVTVGLGLSIVDKISFNFYFGGGAQFSDVNGNKNSYDNIFQAGYTGILPEAGFLFGLRF